MIQPQIVLQNNLEVNYCLLYIFNCKYIVPATSECLGCCRATTEHAIIDSQNGDTNGPKRPKILKNHLVLEGGWDWQRRRTQTHGLEEFATVLRTGGALSVRFGAHTRRFLPMQKRSQELPCLQ